jgi:hypothetical protein
MKNIFIFFTIFLFLIVFTISPFCHSAETPLEVDYPTLSTGASITSQSELTQYLKYLFDIGIFVGFFTAFLSLIYAGILYFISPASPSAVSMARDRVSGAISGILILSLLYLIIVTINPYLAIFKLGKLDPIEMPPEPPPPPGAYFYENQGCSDKESIYSTSSLADFGDKKNKINSARIIQGTDNDNKYISVFYETTDFWGKCHYVDPNTDCQSMGSWGSSASVHRYSFKPSGDIIFYRKSFFDNSGGYLKLSVNDIKSKKLYDLTQLSFTGSLGSSDCTVPEKEQDCIEWNNNKECIKTKCPNLAGENITSIKISGNYQIILFYFKAGIDGAYGPWSFCQEFPTSSDANKEGPQQIKWENVKQQAGMPPTWLFIMPVQEK